MSLRTYCWKMRKCGLPAFCTFLTMFLGLCGKGLNYSPGRRGQRYLNQQLLAFFLTPRHYCLHGYILCRSTVTINTLTYYLKKICIFCGLGEMILMIWWLYPPILSSLPYNCSRVWCPWSCCRASALQSWGLECESREWVSTLGFFIGPHIRREYWCSSQEAELREISISCKNLFLNRCKINVFKLIVPCYRVSLG